MQQERTNYGGDVPVTEAWSQLSSAGDAVLIDVRTTAEWTYVGAPDLASIGKQTVFLAWNDAAAGITPDDFAARLKSELDGLGVRSETPLYFLCRSGQRSMHAAIAATAAGYRDCFNVMDGFEGNLDAEGHRATPGSWKAAELPWRQS